MQLAASHGTSHRKGLAVTAKILIADDEPDLELLIRHRFRKEIRDRLYDFVFAADGSHALDSLQNDPEIEVVLTDLNMPGMDGLSLLSRIVDEYPLMQPVIVSAYGDMTNIRAAMNLGAFDFLTKPIDFRDFASTLDRTVRRAQLLRQSARDQKQLANLQSELTVATRIQQSILPRIDSMCAGRSEVVIQAIMYPARDVGGDFYDFFFLDEHRLGFAIGDVSGKGIPAAIFMAMCRTLLKAIAMKGTSPGECLGDVNRSLVLDNQTEMFVTLFYGILDFRTGEVQYASGAHNPAYILGPNGVRNTADAPAGTVIGLFEDLEFETNRLRLNPSDTIYIDTDGITEAMDVDGKLFGAARVEAFLARSADRSASELIQGIIDEVRRFTGGAPQSDDQTAIVIRYQGHS
ncbi:PP2C family protein-serine/threonine phosphatase [Singulisphaera rosea]